MKLINKVADGMEVFAPVIILSFACASYMRYTENEKNHPEKFRKEIQQEIEKNKADNVSASFIPFRD